MKREIRRLSLDAVSLRCLALGLMLLDHLWATVIPGNLWMTCLGRLAFPIFTFQAAEGFYHTSDFKKYALRLLLFGLISELPFNRMISGSWIDPFHQNVMFTLLLGLLALRAAEQAKNGGSAKRRILAGLAAMGWCVWGAVTFVDYGGYGVMMVLLFGLTRGMRQGKLCQLAGMVLINLVFMEGMTIPVLGMEFPVQGFAVLALIPIWLYNGKKGSRNRAVQYSSYLFYPLHMAVLAGIGYFL